MHDVARCSEARGENGDVGIAWALERRPEDPSGVPGSHREGAPVSHQETFAIVGAGLAGAKAAETLREEGFGGRIVLIGDEPERPYERPPLSKGYLAGKDEREKPMVHSADFYETHDIELRTSTRAT